MKRAAGCAAAALLVASALGAGCARGVSEEGDRTGAAAAVGRARADGVPTIRIAKVVPDPILLNRPVSVEVEAAETDDHDDLAFRYHWVVNGARLDSQRGPTLDPGLLRRGDRVSVQVVPVSGAVEGPPYQAAAVTVGNTPPTVTSVRLDPGPAHRGDRLRALVEAVDPDQDPIRLLYRWWRNRKLELESEEPAVDTAGWMRGDVAVVEVIPFDGSGRGRGLASEPITLANGPPRITSMPATAVDPERYQYLVTATDPDGDALTFTLAEGPPGMSVDRTTGLLVWTRPSDAGTPRRVRVLVEDGHEGQAFQEFELRVTAVAASS